MTKQVSKIRPNDWTNVNIKSIGGKATIDYKPRLVEALHPTQVKTSGRFTAVLGFILDQDWSEPRITALTVTSDGFAMVATSEDSLMNQFLTEASNIERDLVAIAKVAELSDNETQALMAIYHARIRDFREH